MLDKDVANELLERGLKDRNNTYPSQHEVESTSHRLLLVCRRRHSTFPVQIRRDGLEKTINPSAETAGLKPVCQ